jgi:hypothetical protein
MAVKNEPDTGPLIEQLLLRTREGKIPWEPTATPSAFLATVAGNTFRVSLEYDNEVQQEYSCVTMVSEKGHTIWTIAQGVWPLYRAVQRVANKVDERIAGALKALEKL